MSLSHGHLRHSFEFFSMVWGGFEHPFSFKIRCLFPCWPRYPDVSAEAPMLWFHWPLWFRTGSHAGFLQAGTCRDSREIKSRCHRNCAEASWQIQEKSSFAECLQSILCFSSRVGLNKNEHVQFGFSDFSASWCDVNVLYKSLSLRSCWCYLFFFGKEHRRTPFQFSTWLHSVLSVGASGRRNIIVQILPKDGKQEIFVWDCGIQKVKWGAPKCKTYPCLCTDLRKGRFTHKKYMAIQPIDNTQEVVDTPVHCQCNQQVMISTSRHFCYFNSDSAYGLWTTIINIHNPPDLGVVPCMTPWYSMLHVKPSTLPKEKFYEAMYEESAVLTQLLEEVLRNGKRKDVGDQSGTYTVYDIYFFNIQCTSNHMYMYYIILWFAHVRPQKLSIEDWLKLRYKT